MAQYFKIDKILFNTEKYIIKYVFIYLKKKKKH